MAESDVYCNGVMVLDEVNTSNKTLLTFFVELGGGVGDVPFWCRDGASVEFGFR